MARKAARLLGSCARDAQWPNRRIHWLSLLVCHGYTLAKPFARLLFVFATRFSRFDGRVIIADRCSVVRASRELLRGATSEIKK